MPSGGSFQEESRPFGENALTLNCQGFSILCQYQKGIDSLLPQRFRRGKKYVPNSVDISPTDGERLVVHSMNV
jgi:hypothetical protein